MHIMMGFEMLILESLGELKDWLSLSDKHDAMWTVFRSQLRTYGGRESIVQFDRAVAWLGINGYTMNIMYRPFSEHIDGVIQEVSFSGIISSTACLTVSFQVPHQVPGKGR